MTPLEYAHKYRNLEVFFIDPDAKHLSGQLQPPGEWRTVSVTHYRLGLEGDAKEKFMRKVRPHINEKDESITVWVKTIHGAVESRTYTSRKQLAENAVDAFYGKGCPEEVQVTLQLAVRYGVVSKEGIQAYCDEGNIGLDCNGFVGNYIRHVLQGHEWYRDAGKKSKELDASSLIQSMMRWGHPVTKLEEIVASPQRIYLMALVNSQGHILGHNPIGHIVITEPNSLNSQVSYNSQELSTTTSVRVVESTGAQKLGLTDSTYSFLNVDNQGIFTVRRGVNDKKMSVKISVIP
jgi:hypothetical protein